ncbi:MAG: Uma2 family endonuclease [Leptolyngbya sp. ERB_1_1]
MVIAAPEPTFEAQSHAGEQRILIRDLPWNGYLQILGALPESRNSRLTYDDGTLEITMPLEAHEFFGRLIERFILTLVELLGMRVKTMGSTTMNYPDLRKGAEPNNAYYIQNQPLVKGRSINFTQDPPPDLVVEIDGVPEFWRFNGKVWRVYQLQAGVYVEVEMSPTFPQVPKEWLYVFLEQAKEDKIEAVRSLRSWWQDQH